MYNQLWDYFRYFKVSELYRTTFEQFLWLYCILLCAEYGGNVSIPLSCTGQYDSVQVNLLQLLKGPWYQSVADMLKLCAGLSEQEEMADVWMIRRVIVSSDLWLL